MVGFFFFVPNIKKVIVFHFVSLYLAGRRRRMQAKKKQILIMAKMKGRGGLGEESAGGEGEIGEEVMMVLVPLAFVVQLPRTA